MGSNKKIFIGLNNIAGVAMNLKRGFEELGYETGFYSGEIVKHEYNFIKGDDYIDIRDKYGNRPKFSRYLLYVLFLAKILLKFDYFIFLQGSDGYLLTNFKDIRILRFFKKKVAVIFAGCDVRMPNHVKHYKWNVCSNCQQTYKDLVGCQPEIKSLKLEKLKRNFEFIFSPDECGGFFDGVYSTYYFPVRKPVYKSLGSNNSDRKFTIVHAPSNEDYKGSMYIYEAISLLKPKYDFDFVKLQGLPKQELYEVISSADLLIDQMLGGFYGVLSVETMLLGIPVICYIHPDIWKKIENDCPIINASPDDLVWQLDKILSNPSVLIPLKQQSINYAVNYHSPKLVASKMLSVMDKNDLG